MASFSQLSAAFINASQENTVALANLKFDFAIIKCEPPEEYRAIGDCLSRDRKKNAEEGPFHITARKLGALFESDLPDVPHLIRAYGQRATEITGTPGVNPQASNIYGAFSDHVGADSTTIWATATSGASTVTMHLLACMLARIWKQAEAISIWTELVEQRKEVLRLRAESANSQFSISEAMASRIEISRDRLAEWDRSARAWLRTADEAKRVQQTQLRLVLDNISLPVSRNSTIYAAIMESLSNALKALDDLVQGRALRIQSGEVLLGLSSWHLYPDLAVLGETHHHIRLADPLVSPGGVVTVGLQNRRTGADDGIYWSLPLATLHFYGHPVLATGRTGLGDSQVTFDQFLCVVLGAVIQSWDWAGPDINLPVELLTMLDWSTDPICTNLPVPSWLATIVTTARDFMAAKGPERDQMSRLIAFGRRRCVRILGDSSPPPVFGLTAFPNLLNALYQPPALSDEGRQTPQMSKDGEIIRDTSQATNLLRLWASVAASSLDLNGAVILSCDGTSKFRVSDLFALESGGRKRPRTAQSTKMGGRASGTYRSWLAWDVDPEDSQNLVVEPGKLLITQRGANGETRGLMAKSVRLPDGPQGTKQSYRYFCGDRQIAAIFIRDPGSNEAQSRLRRNRMKIKDFFACVKHGYLSPGQIAMALSESHTSTTAGEYFDRLRMFAVAKRIYSSLPGSLVDLNVTSSLRDPFWWEGYRLSDTDGISRSIAFSCIALFDTGNLDLPPSKFKDAMAISSQNSIYVAEILMLDDSTEPNSCGVRRITGNIGKPGVAILIPPSNPKIRQVECDTWRVDNVIFDGTLQDSFGATSLHLSLTGYELPVDSGRHGYRDNECAFIETAVSMFDRGEWVADLDLLKSADQWQQVLYTGACQWHTRNEQSDLSNVDSFLCVDSWLSMLDPPPSPCIVRAHRNPGARLAATCIAIQKDYDFRILPNEPCWTCVGEVLGMPRLKRKRHFTSQDDMVDDEAAKPKQSAEDSDSLSNDVESVKAGLEFHAERVAGDDEPLEPLFADHMMQGAECPSPVSLNADSSSESDFERLVVGLVFIC